LFTRSMTHSNRNLKRVEIVSGRGDIPISSTVILHPYFLIYFLLSSFLLACSSSTTPEQITDDFITACEAFVEKGIGRELRNLIAENYMDSRARTKKDIGAIASGYLLRNRAIYSYSLIDSVIINEDDSISARVLTALAAQPITDVALLPTMNSDIYWFDITITQQNDEWKLIKASWQQAMLEDFFQ
jgi:hypothetical protein